MENMEKDAIQAALHDAGLKATPARIGLLAALCETHRPLSVELLQGKIKLAMDPATLYRSLNAFQKAGLVRQVRFQSDRAYYEIIPRTEHHHVVCMKCHFVRDIEGCDFHAAAQSVLRKARDFAVIREHSFEMFGICKRCTSRS